MIVIKDKKQYNECLDRIDLLMMFGYPNTENYHIDPPEKGELEALTHAILDYEEENWSFNDENEDEDS